MGPVRISPDENGFSQLTVASPAGCRNLGAALATARSGRRAMRVLADGDARPVAVLQLSSEPGWSNAYSFARSLPGAIPAASRANRTPHKDQAESPASDAIADPREAPRRPRHAATATARPDRRSAAVPATFPLPGR